MNNGVQGIQGETGNGIASIQKTGTSGLVDTYTITYTNGNTTTFTVSNGKGISSIVKTGSAGLIDNYRITYNDGTYFDYIVTNGQDGEVTEEELQDVYEQMSSELEDGTLTGTSIDTSDSAYWKAELQPKGNTFQQTYEGYNILKYPYIHTTMTNNGITFTNNGDGTVTANGTATGQAEFDFKYSSDLNIQNGKYYLSGCPAGGNAGTYRINWAFAQNNNDTGNGTVVTYTGTDGAIRILINQGVTVNNLVFRPMIVAREQAKDYEPYVGGTASPNPDYPQDIQVVKGNNNIVINSGNFLDNNFNFTGGKFGNNYIPSTSESATFIFENNILKMKGSAWTGVYDNNYHEILPENQFTFCTTKNKKCYVRIVEYDANKTPITMQSGNLDKTYTTGSNTKYIRFSFELTSTTSDDLIITEIRIVKGSTSAPYVEHQEQNYPITLPTGMVLCKIGDYSDVIFKNEPSNPLYNSSLVENGWYKYSVIGKIILNGTSNNLSYFKLGGNLNTGFRQLSNCLPQANDNTKGYILTSHFMNYSLNDLVNNEYVGCAFSINQFNRVMFLSFGTDENFDTSTKINDWLSSNNTIVYYVLSTPTYTPITDTTLVNQLNDIYNKLKTYQGVTHITQTNEDMPFILTLDYKKSNLLRIKALENA